VDRTGEGREKAIHGEAILRIVDDPRFTSLNRAEDRGYGHYIINDHQRLFLKFRTGAGPSWQFRFSTDEVRAIENDEATGEDIHVALVCGRAGVCLLETSDLWELLSSAPDDGQDQTLTVSAPPRAKFRVAAGETPLPDLVARNRFPDRLFPGTR